MSDKENDIIVWDDINDARWKLEMMVNKEIQRAFDDEQDGYNAGGIKLGLEYLKIVEGK